MPSDNNFDMDAAVAEIGSGLGLGGDDDSSGGDDVEIEVTAPEKEATAEAPAAPPAAAPAEAPEAGTPPPPPAQAEAELIPKTWRKELGAHWSTLPPEVRAEVHRRESDMFRGLEMYRGKAQVGERFSQAIAPFEQLLRQHNIEPLHQVRQLMNAHATLALGTVEQKHQLFAQLAKDYGVDVTSIPIAPYVDPAVENLQRELRELQNRLTQQDSSAVDAQRQTLRAEVESFANDPSHPYFDDVADDITVLIQGGRAKGLQEAYDMAIWANPVTRAKEQQRLNTETAAATEKALRERAQQAAKASRTVRSTDKPGPTAKVGSLDDTLAAGLAAIRARE